MPILMSSFFQLLSLGLIGTSTQFLCQMEGLTASDCGSFMAMVSSAAFWLIVPLTILIALLRSFVWTAAKRIFLPDQVQVIQEVNMQAPQEG